MTLLLQQQYGTRGWEFASTWFPLQPSYNSKEPNSLAGKSESSLRAQRKPKVPGDAKSANLFSLERAQAQAFVRKTLRCVALISMEISTRIPHCAMCLLVSFLRTCVERYRSWYSHHYLT